jgi:hypothetical protein
MTRQKTVAKGKRSAARLKPACSQAVTQAENGPAEPVIAPAAAVRVLVMDEPEAGRPPAALASRTALSASWVDSSRPSGAADILDEGTASRVEVGSRDEPGDDAELVPRGLNGLAPACHSQEILANDGVAGTSSVAGPAPVLIELGQAASGSSIHGRYDILIRGRVVSPAAVEDVALLVEGGILGSARFG